MSEHKSRFLNSMLFLIIVCVPLIGPAMTTAFIFTDDHLFPARILWLLITWLIPFIGPLLYLVLGQRPTTRARITFG